MQSGWCFLWLWFTQVMICSGCDWLWLQNYHVVIRSDCDEIWLWSDLIVMRLGCNMIWSWWDFVAIWFGCDVLWLWYDLVLMWYSGDVLWLFYALDQFLFCGSRCDRYESWSRQLTFISSFLLVSFVSDCGCWEGRRRGCCIPVSIRSWSSSVCHCQSAAENTIIK